MSQPGLFSVRRTRETLGSVVNQSGLPIPSASTIRKRSSSSDLKPASRPAQPLFTRSSSSTNLADLAPSTARRSASNNIFASASTNRQSLAPLGTLTPATQRRSSIYSHSRQSNNAPTVHQSFFTQPPAPAGKVVDPRPLATKTYRERIAQELMTYLTQNNFELEMRCSLNENSLKSPTQRNFYDIFQWLYRRLDPGYKFQKSMDTEVSLLMKQLRYPYEKDITKSQITAVGGNNWSKFLGLLHWMMQLAQMLDRFGQGAYDDACAEAGVDVSGDRIVFRFLFGAYQDWLQVGPEDDDESAEEALVPHVQAMTAEFERNNAKYAEELKMYEAENTALKQQLEEIEKSIPDVATLDKHFKILGDDRKKFEDYNANVQAKIEKYDSRIKILVDEIQKTDLDLKSVEQDCHALQQSVDRQGLNIQDIDRMNTERERLQKSKEDTLAALDEVNRKVLDKEAETVRKLEDLEAIVKRYNSLGYQISLIPSTAANAKGASYELSLNIPEPSLSSSTSGFSSSRSRRSPESDRLLAETNKGHSPAHLLNFDLRGAVRSAFLSIRKEISQRRSKLAESDLNARDILDSVGEALVEKHTEIDTLQHRVHTSAAAYESLKSTTQTQHTQTTSQIEKLEKELARMREGLEKGVLELEQREMEVGVAYDGLREEAGRVREQLHGQVERALEEVIKFKVHVQRGLEEFEGWVGDEVEAELVGDVDGMQVDGEAGGEVFE